MSESNESSNKKYYNYSVLSEDQKALSKTTATETNSNKIGFSKQQVIINKKQQNHFFKNTNNRNIAIKG
jgi:hypothetical protein